MIKKFIIVIVCLVAIVMVLGVNDRLTYDGFDVASRIVTGNIDIVKSDVAFVEVFAYVAESYPLSDDGEFNSEYDSESNTLSMYYMTKQGAGTTKVFNMPSDDVGLKIEGLLDPLEFGFPSNGGLFDDVIDGLNYVIHILVLAFIALQFLLIIIFDSIGVALSVLRAAFYLLGF